VSESANKTPLFEEHQRLGARLVPFAGYLMPLQYRGISAEHVAVRQRAGLFDVSHMGELELRGTQAESVANSLVTNDLGRLAEGQAMYSCCCNEAGTILDDLLVYKWSAEHVLVVCNAANREKISAHFAAAARGRCDFVDRSDETALLALQGPEAEQVLEQAGTDVGDLAHQLGSFHFRSGRVAGLACTIARTGYTGEDGFELFCDNRDAPALYRSLLAAGESARLEPVGLGARDTLRLEARLCLYGNEIDETTNPFEAGLGWTVKLSKGDFVGRAALAELQAAGVRRRLVGFEMTGRGIARHGYALLDRAGNPVGVCTSGAPSPTLGKNIGLGYLPVAMAQVGSELLVDCRGRRIAARVTPTPFYRRASRGGT
jgi:aminomethyltransferase